MIQAHKFFMKEALEYARNDDGSINWNHKRFFPIAYIKFMYLSLKDKAHNNE